MSAPMLRTKTPGIFKRGSRYVYTWRDSGGKLRRRSAATMAEAIAKRGVELDKRNRGERSADRRREFTEYAREWIVSFTGRTDRGVSRETRQDYARALGLRIEFDERGRVRSVDDIVAPGRACDWFGRARLAEIGPRMIRQYAADVAAGGRKKNTVRLALAPIRAMLATAHEDEVILANPMAGLGNLLPKDEDEVDNEHVKALDQDELLALLERLPERWRFFFEFLVEMGLRIGEAVELRWKDLDIGTDGAPALRPKLAVRRRLYRGRIDRPKGGKSRTLRLTRSMADALHARRGDAADDDLVFTSVRGCQINDSNLLARVLKPATVEAGLGGWIETPKGPRPQTWVAFHTFRHTCATSLIVDEGWRLEHVQVYLGHRDIATTRKYYIHLFGDDLPERTSVLERSTSVLGGQVDLDRAARRRSSL